MNILLFTDLEGVTNLNEFDAIKDNRGDGYLKACHELMYDINAAVEGFFQGGADKIYVCDGHYNGRNFIKELLDPRVIQIYGFEWEELVKKGEIDAFAEVGLHAMVGTQDAFDDHTQVFSWFDYKINGVSVGELIQGAGFVGQYGIPMIFVSGDKALAEEAERFIPGIATAVVKYAKGRNFAESLPSEEAREIIRTKAKDSIKLVDKIKPYKIALPATIELTVTRTDIADFCAKYYERIGPRTVRKVIDKLEHYMDLII